MKDTKELRLFLTDQMQRVVEGKTTTERAKGVANLAQQVYNTINMELKMTLAKEKLNGKKVEPVKFD